MTMESYTTSDSTPLGQPLVVDSISNECAKRILNLLKSGEEKINFEPNRDVVLIIGNSGAGKTSFTQFVAGDNNRLISTEVGEYTGEFIISDYDNEISVDSTIISKTTFPRLVVDHETKTAYIDNPGFNDSRNEAYDVAAAYFIKKVLDTVKNVKIVILTNYPSVRKGVSRNDFLSLLEHVTVLLKDMDKYVDSIALVATKVDNAFVKCKGVPALIPDNAIIENIASFLAEVKESLKKMQNDGDTYISESKRIEGEQFYENAIKLLDALLTTKKDSTYARLGVFRRPDEPGQISQIELLQNNKKSIKNMIRKNLRYRSTKNTEIGYTLSDKSKNVMQDLITQINKDIVSDMAFINDDFIAYYRNLEFEMLSDDMYVLCDRLASASKALSCITNTSALVNATDFVNLLCENFTNIGVHVRKSRLRDIANLGKFLIFLQGFGTRNHESFIWKWTKELDEAVQYIDNSLKYYNFLAGLHSRLSHYEVQKNKSSYPIPTFPTLPSEGVRMNDLPDLLAFLDAVGDKTFCETIHFKAIKEIRLDDTKIRFFDHLVQVTLKDTPVYTSFDEGQRVQVASEYILLSEVLANELYNSCKSMQIFAKQTVFVDASLVKDDAISIVAPQWEIIGKPVITLDGKAAVPLSCAKAKNGQHPGTKGKDGLPGPPGTSAGNFLGIGSVFKNLENLSISANGGCGGRGQDGGNGAAGGEKGPSNTNGMYVRPITYVSTTDETLFTMPGGRGGDSGCGGIGGIGGYKGTLITVDTSDSGAFENCVKICNDGNTGESGKPGQPGNGGRAIDVKKSDYVQHKRTTSRNNEYISRGEPEPRNELVLYFSFNDQTLGHRGNVGGGVTEKGRQLPETKQFQNMPSLVLDNFIGELIKNLTDCIKKRASLRFYQQIYSNPELHEYYNVNILSNQVQWLDVHCNRFSLDTASTLYRLIFEKILRVVPSQPDERTMLESLRLVTTSKLLGLQVKPDHCMILKSQSQPPLEFIFNVLELLIENNLDPAIESTIEQIIELSCPQPEEFEDNLRELGVLLHKHKLLGDLRKLSHFLHLLSIHADTNYQILNKETPAMKHALENIFYQFQRNAIDSVNALSSLIINERKLYQNSEEPQAQVLNSLRGMEKALQSAMYSRAKSFSPLEIGAQLIDSLKDDMISSCEKTMLERIEIRKRIIDFDAQIYHGIIGNLSVKVINEALENNEHNFNKFQEIDLLIGRISKIISENFDSHDPEKILEARMVIADFLDCVLVLLHNLGNAELSSITYNLIEMTRLISSIYGATVVEEVMPHICESEPSRNLGNHMKMDLESLLKNPPEKFTVQDRFHFEWEYSLYARNIADLLRGKQVPLTATVSPNDHRQFLRFASINLRFQAIDKNMQESLNTALSNFDIRMVHSGSSSFAFCNQIHFINEKPCEYQHTVDTDAKTEQLRSPYTMWLLSLHPTRETVTFRSLRPFVNQPVSLQLQGNAKYLEIDDETALREKFEMATMDADYSTLMQ